ncbi:MAG: hypothetical protein SXQ77_04995, partial [Halobacteria archaeon]|nr:hypothetical protein [Halobacteria archaeon]
TEERDALAAKHGYRARLRDDDTLVLYPDDWVEEGEVRVEDIEDTSRAVEVPLEGHRDWEEARDMNDEILDELKRDTEDFHYENARAFAEFTENHYSMSVKDVRPKHVREFLEDYYVRNTWTSEEAQEKVEASLYVVLDAVNRTEVIEAIDRNKTQ